MLVDALNGAATASSARSSTSRRSSTTTSRRRDDLPVGWTDVQDAATYRLERRDDEARFGYAVGPHSWKQFLFPPGFVSGVPSARATARSRLSPDEDRGARAPRAARRPRAASCTRSRSRTASSSVARIRSPTTPRVARASFIVAVNCFEPGGTCFCVSMETGPKVESGYDLALTEILDGEHRFLVEVGIRARRRGAARAAAPRSAEPGDLEAATAAVDGAAERMGRTLETRDIRDLLAGTLEHQRWDDVASRCLTCGNCTLVCPTCFCSTVDDAQRPRRRGGRASPRLGLVLLGRPRVHPRRKHPRQRQVALPAVADTQVRHVARPVRHVRVCRLRSLHHVVPGRHRRHRGARGASHP